MKLLSLIFSISVASLALSSEHQRELCSKATLEYLCANFDTCSLYGSISPSMKDTLCSQFEEDDDEQFCSRATLEERCENYEKCSQFGDLITEEMRDTVCLEEVTPEPEEPTTPEPTTPKPEETTTDAYVTEEEQFTTEKYTDQITYSEEATGFVTDFGESTTVAPDEPDVPFPKITAPPVNITVKPGDAGKFACTAEGAPSPQITITKKEDVVRPVFHNVSPLASTRVQSQTAENLIKNVDKSNEGWYTCLACNRHGCEEHDAYLTVVDLCEDVTCPGLQECVGDYKTGTGYTCECTLPCDPLKMIENAPVCTNYCETKSNVCKMKLDSCLNNKSGVEVLSAGRCPDIATPTIQEDITSDLGRVEVLEGEELELSCFAEGTPTPTIVWYHNGAEVGTGNVLTLTVYPEHEGEYTCVATNCMENTARKTVAIVSVVTEFEKLVIDAPRSTCSVMGDPHFLTYDGLSYSYSGVCDNLLAMDCDKGSWYVYGRMTPCGDSGSCLEAVTLYIGTETIELQRGWLLNRYGKKIVTKNSPNKVITVEDSAHSITAVFDGSNLRVTALLSEEQVSETTTVLRKIVIDWDGYVSAQIQTPRDTQTCGMCGNNDGYGGNDMVTRRGGMTGSVEEFGDSWQVDPLGQCGSSQPAADLVDLCGERVEEVRRECEAVFNSPAFTACRDEVGHDTEHFVKSCMEDTCKGQFTPLLEPRCVVAQAYVQRCAAHFWQEGDGTPVFYWDTEGWEAAVACPGPLDREETVVGTGCPQPASLAEEATWRF